MANTALPAPHHPVRRRALGGLLDADGWTWAGVKAVFWFVVLVTLLGWIPDRAYYFTVQRTVELWPAAPFLHWAPINFCPPSNETLPCPAPGGSTLPWHTAPEQVRLPAARVDGVGAAMGLTFIYAGGSDGTAPVADTYFSRAVAIGNIDAWKPGPALPAARADAASVVVGSTMFVIGGYGPDGKPTDTVFSITVGSDGKLGEWKTVDALKLPEPRAGATAVTVSDGIVVLGGANDQGATNTVWKTQAATGGTYGKWTPQATMFEANKDGIGVHVGDVIFVLGGTNAKGEVVATVQQGLVGGPGSTAKDPNIVQAWRVSAETNLPGPRTNMSGFTANGGIYLQGGSDGTTPRNETVWATPDADGVIPAWNHLDATYLGEGLEGSTAVVIGSNAILMAGRTPAGLTADLARANLAPQEPFFQLGLIGMTVPGLKLDGEIGQQLGYLNAATVGAVNFVLMILLGYAFNHKEKVVQLREAIRRRRRRS